MNKDQLISKISTKTGMETSHAKAALDHILSLLSDHLSEKNTVIARGFGTLKPVFRKSRKFYNPTTKTVMEAPPKVAVSFKPSPSLIQRINRRR